MYTREEKKKEEKWCITCYSLRLETWDGDLNLKTLEAGDWKIKFLDRDWKL